MAQVIRDCGNEPAFIVGHSIGGWVGVHLAALAPGEVAGLVLVDIRIKLSRGRTGRGNVGSIRCGNRVCRAFVWSPATPLQTLR
jgi:pimeloyl-ACP methyl ester carboxylesterase